MVNGLDNLKQILKPYSKNYVIIGGTASSIHFDKAGLEFRSTKDIDMVIVLEEVDLAFGKMFWEFIEKGEYISSMNKDGVPKYYRFISKNTDYPSQIEIFSRSPFLGKYETAVKPIHIDDNISSLSAIVLDKDYYNLLLTQKMQVDDFIILSPIGLIIFKAKAFLDLSERKSKEEGVDSRDIDKHKNDVFRLAQLLSESDNIDVPNSIFNDFNNFLIVVEKENVDTKSLKIPASKNEIIALLSKYVKGQTR
jgi:hypothetical protein